MKAESTRALWQCTIHKYEEGGLKIAPGITINRKRGERRGGKSPIRQNVVLEGKEVWGLRDRVEVEEVSRP